MSEQSTLVIVENLPPRTEHVIDGYNQYGVFKAFHSFEVSGDAPEMLAASEFRNVQKEDFLAGRIKNPQLNNCPNFDMQRDVRRGLYLETRSLMLAQALRREAGEPDTAEDRLLNNKLAIRVNELGYVETAALMAQGGLVAEERQRAGEILRSAGREIYGMPSRDRALGLIDIRLKKAQKIAGTEDHPARTVASELLEMVTLPEYDSAAAVVKMDDETAEYYRALMKEECQEAVESAFAEMGIKDLYTPDEIVKIFDRYSQARGFAEYGWHAELIPNRSNCVAKLKDTKIEVGSIRGAESRTYEKVLESMIHELEIHAGRDVKGKKLGAKILEFGLPHAEEYEEPFASTVASIYQRTPKGSGEIYTLGLALAAGFDGKERDFRETFESMWRLGLVNTYKADKPYDDQVAKAQKNAYGNLVRIWRGMPTDVPGCVFPKDRVYDNSEVMKSLTGNGQVLPKVEFLRLLEAKYNPFDPEQDAYVRSLTS